MTGTLSGLHDLAASVARDDFPAFLAYVGRDDEGSPFDRREVDALTWGFAEECFADGAPCGIMLPFGSGKTTLACYRAAWQLGRDTNALVSVVSYSLERAQELVALVRRVVSLDSYRRVFPHVRVLPGRDSAARFTVQREGVSNNPSVSGHGVLTGTGVRTTFLLMDDVVTLKNSILEPTNRARVLDAVRTTWMSRRKMARERVCWLQTSYHEADAASVLRKDTESGWRWLVVRAEEPYEVLKWEKWERGACVEVGTVASPWPAEALAERARQMGPTAASRGLANRPVSAESCPFRAWHFDGPDPLPVKGYARRVLYADPAGDFRRVKSGDPDWCAVVGLGWHPEAKCWEVVVAERMRGSPLEQARFIASAAVRAHVSQVWQEASGAGEALVEVTQRVLRDAGHAIAVRPVKPTTNKEQRITQTLEPALAAVPPLLRVCGTRFHGLRDEALVFPAGAHDDLVDALAGAFGQAPGADYSYLLQSARSADDYADDDEDNPLADEPARRFGRVFSAARDDSPPDKFFRDVFGA